MSLAGLRIEYIHGERLSNAGGNVSVNININIDADGAVKRGDVVEVPFTATVATVPSIMHVTVRGYAVLQGVDPKNIPQNVLATVSQLIMFELMLITRELGLPPPIPVPQPQTQGKQEQRDSPRYA